MELSCDIIRRRKYSINNSSLLSNIKILSNIKKLDIGCHIKNNNPIKFEKVVETYLPHFDHLAKHLFNKDLNLGYALLLTYYISEYPTETLYNNSQEKSNQDIKHKIFNAANHVILFLEGINDNVDEFCDAVDYYYSLYKIWTSDDIYKINNLFDELYNLCYHNNDKLTIYKLTIYKLKIINILDKMFALNTKMTIQILLENYKYFVTNKIITKHMWGTITRISNSNPKKEDSNIQHIILIMITRLRIELISLLSNSVDLKDIYYRIDTEDIIRNIRNYTFNQSKINHIINILTSKIHKLYPTSKISLPHHLTKQLDNKTTNKYYKDIFSIFKSMFNILYNK